MIITEDTFQVRDEEPEDFELLIIPDHCFYCGETLSLPCIMWQADFDQAYFHPECAKRFAEGLLNDVAELE